MNSEPLCQNRKFWGRSWKKCCDRIDLGENPADDDATIDAHSHDDAGLRAYFQTGPLFGCNKFEIRVEKRRK